MLASFHAVADGVDAPGPCVTLAPDLGLCWMPVHGGDSAVVRRAAARCNPDPATHCPVPVIIPAPVNHSPTPTLSLVLAQILALNLAAG